MLRAPTEEARSIADRDTRGTAATFADGGPVEIVGKVALTEGPNAAGDRVWLTGLVTPSGRVVDLGTLLDAFPPDVRAAMRGRVVHVLIQELPVILQGEWGPWAADRHDGEEEEDDD